MRQLRREHLFLGLSITLCVLSWCVFATQPDALAWLMIFPRWTWLAFGLVLLGLGFSKPRWKWSPAIAVLWCFFAWFNIEETRSILRAVAYSIRAPAAEEGGFRVVSLNCAGDGGAVDEAFLQEPELILLQESPSEHEVRLVAAEYWGPEASIAWSPDTTIVARGPITIRGRSRNGGWIWVTWHRNDGDVEAVSFRRRPVPLRFDFWSLDCWRAMAELRETHRKELAEVLAVFGDVPENRRCLIGGDFNSPAHDPTVEPLVNSFHDAFDEAGVGWGNTIVNGCPVHRIDQVWISRAFKATRVKAITSDRSDHRLVVCDLLPQ